MKRPRESRRPRGRMIRTAGPLVLSWCALAGGGEARAQPAAASVQERSDALFDEGMDLASEGKFEPALEMFRKSYELVSRPEVVWNIARAEMDLHENAAAFRDLTLYLTRFGAGISPAERARAEARLGELRAVLGVVKIVVSVPEASVTAGGMAVEGSTAEREVWLDPGEIVIRAEARGRLPATQKIVVKKGRNVPVILELRRPPLPVRVEGFPFLGLGVTGIVTSGILLGLTLEKTASMGALCGDGGMHCPDEDAVRSYSVQQQDATSLANAAQVSFALGAAVSLVGVAITLTPAGGRAARLPAPLASGAALLLRPVAQGAILSLGGAM